MREQLTGYQVRPSGGTFHVFLVKADGEVIPVDRQRSMYADASRSRADTVCNQLNNGLLSRVTAAINAERQARA